MVLFPEPLGPISPTTAPASTSNATSSTAVSPRYRLVRPLTSSSARAAVTGPPGSAAAIA